MIWTRQLSVGNLIIDSGHQNLIGIINSIEYAVKQKNISQLLRVYEKFYDSAQLHFNDEETIMRAIRFPFVPHKLQHQNLLNELQRTHEGLVANKGAWPEHVMEPYPDFLRGWFVDHIKGGITTLKPVLEGHPYDFMPA